MPIDYQARYKNSWALVIGINSYLYTNPLSYACNDADAVASILADELGFPSSNIVTLRDEQATKNAVMDAYLSFSSKANNVDDRIIVFFAGHGATIDGLRGPIGYLVPVDGNLTNLSSLIRWDDLTRNADLILAKHILFIIDACYSGLAAQRVLTPGTQRFVSDMLQRFARQVITAGKADETVADGGGSEGKNSIFTGYLVEGIRGAAVDSNNVLTANALMHYVYQKVGQDNRSKQTPHYGHIEGDGDFILKTPQGQDFLTDTLPEKPEPIETTTLPGKRPSYAERANYIDPSSANFGRNEWSEKLGEDRWGREFGSTETSKAFSWLSLIIEPISNEHVSIDIAEQLQRMQELRQPKANARPFEQYAIPFNARTTINSLILFDEISRDREFWADYVRLDRAGNLEYADSRCVFGEFDGLRHFRYVQIIGAIWQFLYLAQNVLTDAGYEKGVRLLVNLVGTKDTILADFSIRPGEGGQFWLDPMTSSGARDRSHLFQLKCPDQNLQMEYNLVIGTLDEEAASKITISVARQLGLAYNHQTEPRCFNYKTTDFPWDQFFNVRNHCR